MSLKFPFLLLFSVLASLRHARSSKGTYIIVAPNAIRPNRPYTASANILKSGSEIYNITLEITNWNDVTVAAKSKQISYGNPAKIEIAPIPPERLSDIPSYYRLKVKGEIDGKTNFAAQVTVRLEKKYISTFIQTDKAIYKPGSNVHFRVVIVTPELKPYQDTVSLKIVDSQENIIKQWLNVFLDQGVASKEIQLADEVPFGNWVIKTETKSGVKSSKSFTVEKYVLPKFEITMSGPTFVTNKDFIAIIVKAKYTYGKGVSGPVSISAKIPMSNDQGLIKTATLNKHGEATMRFTNKECVEARLLNNGSWSGPRNVINFVATVTEKLTGIQRNGSIDIPIHDTELKIKVEKFANYFKPGMKYNLLIAVVRQDNTPIPSSYSHDVKLAIKYIQYGIWWPMDVPPPGFRSITENEYMKHLPVQPPPPIEVEKVIKLGNDGTTWFELEPNKDIYEITINAIYKLNDKDITTSHLSIQSTNSPSNSFLQLTAKKKEVNAGQKIEFMLKSTENIGIIVYQVMSRGKILSTGQKTITGMNGNILVDSTEQMSPKSRLVVYKMREENKEILVDALDFKVKGLYQNNVQLSLDKSEAEPGQKVKVTVTADPGSFVGLLAVDQSVLLLKKGNDITTKIVENEVETYDSSANRHCYWCDGRWFMPTRRRRSRRSIYWPWWINGEDAQSIFQNSGLIWLSDALIYKKLIRMPDVVRYDMIRYDQIRPMLKVRPPELGPVPVPAPIIPVPKRRSKFPETWLWLDSKADTNGQLIHEATVPDTITSWITSAFAIHENSGLGLAPSTVKLLVFRPFFLRLNLPYSVKRGEKLALQVLVFNYQSESQTVRVTLVHDENSDFDFVEKSGVTKSKNYNVRMVEVAGDGGTKSVFFPILPTKIGEIKLHVSAIGGRASDAVEVPLLVEPEGYRVVMNEPTLINVSSYSYDPITRRPFKKTVQLHYPDDAIEGSKFARVSLIGDIMGPMLENIENLVSMPSGCGEQNMVKLVPNIVVVKYLQATNRLQSTLKAKAIKFMESGYQQEMTYRHYDGSFSAFGPGFGRQSDKKGSTWLTAFVVRSFKQAQPYIYIDDEKLSQSVEFLKRKQKENGQFAEEGNVLGKYMQGGVAQGEIPLTAYVLISLLENEIKNIEAVEYLENSLQKLREDSYTLALTTYALHLAKSQKKDQALGLLEAKAVGEQGLTHWTVSVSQPENEFSRIPPVDVETTAYALLIYVLRGELNKAQPIIRWLNTKRNPYGGFSSTQDTVVGLQALGAYAEKVFAGGELNMNVGVKNGNNIHSFKIDSHNSLVLQSYEIENIDSSVEISARGSGVGLVQVSWHYHTNKVATEPSFRCIKGATENKGTLTLDICCNYRKTADGSGMAVLELDSLSGYVFDESQLDGLKSTPDLQRIELTKANTKASFYFEKIPSNPICLFNAKSEMVYRVVNQKPAQLVLYDYYEPGDRVETEYSKGDIISLEKTCPECWQDDHHPLFFADHSDAAVSDCSDRWLERCTKWKNDGHCEDSDGIIGRTMEKYCKRSCQLCKKEDYILL